MAAVTTSATGEVLARLESYYDTAPRAVCETEEHGPLTLFGAFDPEVGAVGGGSQPT